ncbi:hypothetical protein WN944_000979 [Citrus x changshan-huyou]|uniref:Transmembrane protein n=1 Tax=Citrus x changshan-huyou TaxID=2935761 RepID=A0AAP0MDV8_9ROSI
MVSYKLNHQSLLKLKHYRGTATVTKEKKKLKLLQQKRNLTLNQQKGCNRTCGAFKVLQFHLRTTNEQTLFGNFFSLQSVYIGINLFSFILLILFAADVLPLV